MNVSFDWTRNLKIIDNIFIISSNIPRIIPKTSEGELNVELIELIEVE